MQAIEVLGVGEFPVAVDYLVALQEFAAERGVSPLDVLDGTGLQANILIKPGVRVGHASMDQAVKNVIRHLPDPYLSIAYGRRLTISKHGGLGFAAQSSATLLDAAKMMEQYLKTRSGGGEEFTLIEQSDRFCLRIEPLDPFADPDVLRFHLMSMLFSIEAIARRLTSTQSVDVPAIMRFSFDFEHIIPCEYLSPGLKLEFGCGVNELSVPAEIMTKPLIHASPSLVSAAQARCEEEMALLDVAHSVSSVVRQLIRAENGRLPTIEQISQRMNMSSRTLKRRLQEAGTSYQHIKDGERFRKAMQLLEQTRSSLENIAEVLGYSDASNFSKAFKGWSGMLPGEFRDKCISQ